MMIFKLFNYKRLSIVFHGRNKFFSYLSCNDSNPFELFSTGFVVYFLAFCSIAMFSQQI